MNPQMQMNPMGMPPQMNPGMMPLGGQMPPQGMMPPPQVYNNNQRNMPQNNMMNNQQRGGLRGNGNPSSGYKGPNGRDNYNGQGNNRYGGNQQYSGSGRYNGQHQSSGPSNPPYIKKSIHKDYNPSRQGGQAFKSSPNGSQGMRRDRGGFKNENSGEQNYHNNNDFNSGYQSPQQYSRDGKSRSFGGHMGGGMNRQNGNGPRKYHNHNQEINQNKLSVTAFHKTKMCPTVESGQLCKKGDNCGYAHTQEELREPPNLRKTKLCQLFKMTRCNKGDQCDFAHGPEELKNYVDRYKTMICQAFDKTGSCPNGDKCHYAHGNVEVRQPQFYTDSNQASTSSPSSSQQGLPQQQQQQQSQQQSQLQSPNMQIPNQQPSPSGYQQLMNHSPIQYGYTDQYANTSQYQVPYTPQSTGVTAYAQTQPVLPQVYTQPLPQTQVFTQSYPTQPLQQYTSSQPIQYLPQAQQYQSYV